ncbi:hypothetical protein KFK09_001027 [Dendrobium nobile]|uniref:Uncharacterized protein n=1 Tax=Dendrobium nobile TaxID=94219 RepID=A0A8T3CDG2_DENNO|nr:hypothetical protein KFK09_001027 [Dendrobium nobile]
MGGTHIILPWPTENQMAYIHINYITHHFTDIVLPNGKWDTTAFGDSYFNTFFTQLTLYGCRLGAVLSCKAWTAAFEITFSVHPLSTSMSQTLPLIVPLVLKMRFRCDLSVNLGARSNFCITQTSGSPSSPPTSSSASAVSSSASSTSASSSPSIKPFDLGTNFASVFLLVAPFCTTLPPALGVPRPITAVLAFGGRLLSTVDSASLFPWLLLPCLAICISTFKA